MIHHTVGVYPNGQMKSNGVSDDQIIRHKDYNVAARPGRALFVDGVCYYKGHVSDEVLAQALVKITAMTKPTKDNRPYH
jgi:hypothetical protein